MHMHMYMCMHMSCACMHMYMCMQPTELGRAFTGQVFGVVMIKHIISIGV